MIQDRQTLDSYFRPHVRDLKPYVPVEALEILAHRHGLDPDTVSKLDFNENPYGPSPKVAEALASLPNVHLYPDPLAGPLREEIANYAGVPESRILIGSGADEIISLIVGLFVEPGDAILDLPPTYSMYGGVALQHAGRVESVPRTGDWRVDVPATVAAIRRGARVTWVCSPNNPTGQLAGEEEVVPLLETGAPVVVDEAYFEFAGRTFAPLLHAFPNLLIMRTFSKLMGLAGLRIGYVLAHERVIEHAQKIKLPFNTTAASQAAALAALRDRPILNEHLRRITAERARMCALLTEQGVLTPYPSDANYVLCRVGGGDAEGLHARLAEAGVFVRYFPKPRIDDCLRISVGRPEDTDRLLAALAAFRSAPQA
jgi:histidinol-phosphate aminotransferase